MTSGGSHHLGTQPDHVYAGHKRRVAKGARMISRTLSSKLNTTGSVASANHYKAMGI